MYYREDEVKKHSELKNIQKARIGFYYLVFELLFGENQRYEKLLTEFSSVNLET